MIRAELIDGSYVRLAPKGLDLLLNHGRVRRFLRGSGWATVGIDRTRARVSSRCYQGPERRQSA